MSSNFWADQVAKEVVEREKKLGRVSTFRTEMGLGASGIPHVGSTGDGNTLTFSSEMERGS